MKPHARTRLHFPRNWREACLRDQTPNCRSAFRNDRRPSAFDKKILLWAGRFKKEEDIPALLSPEVIKAATSRVRIKACYASIALTLLGCLVMILSGKQAAKRDDTLLRKNMEKKAKWRAEVETDLEAAAAKAQ
ncbi:protein FAM162B-like isoform X2 [Emydura macquarii macquarii]|uniref:protein FAM162B-like isoform X2 n=1 Tax=Emydura macquarii macquarii TaxID=1129001 RepID=UPI00352AAC5B